MAAGRPRIFDNVETLEIECIKYFDLCKTEKKTVQTDCGVVETLVKVDNWVIKPTVTGLALFLTFADKTTLYEYRDRPEFSYPIKRALTIIEQYHEEGLSENNVAGRIFALKNMGWKDRQETELTGKDGEPLQMTIPSITVNVVKPNDKSEMQHEQ